MASFAAPSASSNNYEVFLNFRGKDLRCNFVGHLYRALRKDGVYVFKDNEELDAGVTLETIFDAIENSKISITIFSRDYTSSDWCLRELTKIMQCRKKDGQLVVPVFYDVKPSELSSKEGSFAMALNNYVKDFGQMTVDEWKNALTEVSKIRGHELEKIEDSWDTPKLLRIIVQDVLNIVNHTPFTVAKKPTRVDSIVQKFKSFLSLESVDDRQFVGIWGIGGIGKSTIAMATCNEIYKQFHRKSFLANIREKALQPNGLISLQNQLLTDVCGDQNFNIGLVEQGKKLIEKRLQLKKVLLILDDVVNAEQLDALAGNLKWFGPGSRIIITSRYKDVIKGCQIGDDKIFQPKLWDSEESLELFSRHAFPDYQPSKRFLDLSKRVVEYAEGLPLTLELLGIHLRTKEENVWESALQRLEENIHRGVYEKLKISYDGLESTEKEIFLDIACFFIGMDQNLAITIWEGCKFNPIIGLNELIQKSLVRLSQDEKLEMHSQLRDMGKEIVREESPKEPGKRSRLWSHENIMEVINACKEAEKVEGIGPNSGWEIDRLNTDNLKNMSNLRLLQVNGVKLEGNIMDLPSSKLIWLCWQRCPFEIMPSNFCLESLVLLDLSGSNINETWNIALRDKQFEHLKVLDLSSCLKLAKTPDFSGFPKLERLILKGCTALCNIQSIEQLKSLTHLDLNGSLQLDEQLSFPTFNSLENFVLSDGCEWKINCDDNEA